MNILVACEFSGTVREEFKKLGHNAWSCDLLPTEIPGNHYQCDVFDVIDYGWDLMIAHPPCTYLSNAGARFLYPNKKLNEDRLRKGLTAKDFFMRLYWSNIDRICIENPTPSSVYMMPKHTQTIQPFEFGHPFSKRTNLWLKNLPPLEPTNILTNFQSTKAAGNWFNKGGKDRQKNRAKTFKGIAEAMARQWGKEQGE